MGQGTLRKVQDKSGTLPEVLDESGGHSARFGTCQGTFPEVLD